MPFTFVRCLVCNKPITPDGRLKDSKDCQCSEQAHREVRKNRKLARIKETQTRYLLTIEDAFEQLRELDEEINKLNSE